ncbi:MAG TPA: UDP-N-acetylmuramoyl-tripeptide--D-alanyl-D-alanine ligase [Acidimicrobiales bacterium]|nr:UDP-N-acetylmuramoyl-tripeptide--D-alanyl-D-alanine ligase [Acidimicrobiales bacterium]
MIQLDALRALSGAELRQDGASAFGQAATDTRTLADGDLFFALAGARDGHAFIPDAVTKGAAGVVVSDPSVSVADGVTMVFVPDTLWALQQLAAAHRRRSSAEVVAVTGSVGKTTTKTLIAAVLRTKHDILANEASYNNHIGVPLTLLGIEDRHTHVVSEVGTNHRGEIDALAELIDPDLAVLTTIGYAHVGNFASRDELADEKADLLRRVRPHGVWVLNGDDALLATAAGRIDRPDVTAIRVGFGPGNDIRATDVVVHEHATVGRIEADGRSLPFELPAAGHHVVYAALLAVAVGRHHGVDLPVGIEALRQTPPPAGRADLHRLSDDLLVIDDSYNASPDAVLSALDLLGQLPGRAKVAVLGEMRELGDFTDELHQLAGTHAGAAATHLVTIGAATKHLAEAAVAAGLKPSRVITVDSALDAHASARRIVDSTPGPTVVLVKGSRFRHTERVYLGLTGRQVACGLDVCSLYINCASCPKLSTGSG